VFLELKGDLRFQTGLIGLMLVAGLAACSNPNTPQAPIGDPGKTSTVEGSLGTGLETDIELFGKPGLRLQATGEPDNVLTGTYVVAVNADGEVLASSSVDAKGKFSLTMKQGQAIALALATKGPSEKWLCQQTLQYQNPTDAQADTKIAVLELATASVNAGNFTWKASNGRATSAPAAKVTNTSATNSSTINSSAFADESLNGFMRCGNELAKETKVQADFDLEFSNNLPLSDPAQTYTNSFVFGLDTSGSRPRFKGSARINKNGSLEMRVRHEPGQAVKLAPVITDDRPVTAGIALMPTWNLGLSANDVVQQPQLGKLTGEVVLVDGAVQANNETYISGARVNWTQNAIPSLIAFGRGISGPPSEAAGTENPGGVFKLLVPKRSKQSSETYNMNITDPITLEQTNIDVSVTADATGTYAGFSLGGNALLGGAIRLEKAKARRVVVDVTFTPSSKRADVKLTYLTGTGSIPFWTLAQQQFTASESGSDTVLKMDFSSNDTSLKNSDFVFAQLGLNIAGPTEAGSNISLVYLGNCYSFMGCNSSNLTANEFARAVLPVAASTVQANAMQITQQVNNAGTELIGISAFSQEAFPVKTNSIFGLSSTSLNLQLRWPTVNTAGRSAVTFRLNYLTIARQ
jgi:hypothetical protein